MNILLTKKYFEDDLNYIKSKLVSSDINFVDPGKYDEQTLTEALTTFAIDVLFGDFFTEGMLTASEHLKLIQIPWTGVDRVNFSLADQYNVPISNSHSNALAVAEHAVTLALSLLRMIPYHDKKMREGDWCRPSAANGNANFFPPVTLIKQKVGFIGYGAIAKDIRKLLSGFNCEFLAMVNSPAKHQDQGLAWIGDNSQKNELAERCKIVFVAAALTPQTTGMIDKAFLEALGPDGYIVNVSRGQLLNEEDIYNALKDRTIAGAALDTWYKYPTAAQPIALPSQFAFQDLSNIILSPHRAGFLKDQLPHLDDAIENLNNLYSGKPLINIISKEKCY